MFHVRQTDDACIIEVDRDLDLVSASTLTSAIALADESAAGRTIIVSLEHSPYCDGSGLGVLATAKKLLGARLVIVVPLDNRVRRVFDLTGLSEHLALRSSVRDALAVVAAGSELGSEIAARAS
jgi:anti-anti-sigma factor